MCSAHAIFRHIRYYNDLTLSAHAQFIRGEVNINNFVSYSSLLFADCGNHLMANMLCCADCGT